MTLTRVQIPCSNHSPRGGSAVRLIVLHTTEGALSYQSLGNFFIGSTSGPNPTSSHVGIDDTPNTVGEYVQRSQMSWTAGNANPVAVQAEMCTPSGAAANWTTADWNAHPTMLANCAAWIAEEAAHFSIPLVKLTAQQAQTDGRGVCQHRDLGAWGGGHYDCGDGFPIDDVIALAQGDDMPLSDADKQWISQTIHAQVLDIVRSDEFKGRVRDGSQLIIPTDQFKNTVRDQANSVATTWVRSDEFKGRVRDGCELALEQ